MAGLCEGGNEPPGSLKANENFITLLDAMNFISTAWEGIDAQTINCFRKAEFFKGGQSYSKDHSAIEEEEDDDDDDDDDDDTMILEKVFGGPEIDSDHYLLVFFI
ncbi:hypothetical protein ANN_26163 [Periplaneta americana]|uniref:Uncharacterized protein n=1 Tax=Periplaneta americana TaxID=6978 RepID=A0ABQ8S5I4_PERAM|nr:hypothetical protein ANN_26163 [Periplaneta americana]